jgi:hypothetical protein
MHLPDRRVGRVKKDLCTGDPKTSRFYWGLWTWEWSVLENRVMCH